MANSTKAIIITSATNAGTDSDFVFYAVSDGAGAISVTLVGTLNTVDIDNYVAANFLI
jgi:hypothetical protein